MIDEERTRTVPPPKYHKYAAAAAFVRTLGWKMDSCGDAAMVYAPAYDGLERHGQHVKALADIHEALQAALAAERERCVHECLEAGSKHWQNGRDDKSEACDECADIIRALGDEK